jgi:quercetin dioxygenase-like cupin family protein
MKRVTLILGSISLAGIVAGVIVNQVVNAQQQTPIQLRPLPLKHTQVNKMDVVGAEGKQGVVVAVEYAPGASDHRHYHSGQLFTYVVEGAMIWEVDGQPPITLNAGDSFYDPPKQVHNHRNASATAPAKFVAFFVEDKGQPRSVPVK